MTNILLLLLASFFKRLGKIPEHVAFIMDGNRRFARNKHIKTAEGHQSGFSQLENTLKWCLELQIREVTVYAFSIENFKRSKEEIDDIFALAKIKFAEFIQNDSFINKMEIRVKVIGNLSLLPVELRNAALKVNWETRNNSKFTLNIACPYTTTEELETARLLISEGLKNNEIKPEDVTDQLVNSLLYTDRPLSILVRTSGEIRLSDFMLVQASRWTLVHFVDCLWPDYSFWAFLPVLFLYQFWYKHEQALIKKYSAGFIDNDRTLAFISKTKNDRIESCKF